MSVIVSRRMRWAGSGRCSCRPTRLPRLTTAQAPAAGPGGGLLERYRRHAQELAQWRAEHGRWPRVRGTDLGGEEKRLGDWLQYQRGRARPDAPRPLTVERRAICDELLPGWDDPDLSTRVHPRSQPTRTTCTVPDCGRPHVARGLCRRHYGAAWTRGELP